MERGSCFSRKRSAKENARCMCVRETHRDKEREKRLWKPSFDFINALSKRMPYATRYNISLRGRTDRSGSTVKPENIFMNIYVCAGRVRMYADLLTGWFSIGCAFSRKKLQIN